MPRKQLPSLSPACGHSGRASRREARLQRTNPSSCRSRWPAYTAYEYSKDNNISFRIAQISFPFANITNDYFESIFYEGNKRVGKSNIYDLVIGNPPYGEFSGAYAGNKREGNKTLARTYEQYFMWAGIELLKQGGLLCYIIPSTFLDNSGSYEKFKDLLFEKSELIDAYRMPKGAFDKTDLQTDIILLRKK